jgi:hypothetical protein
VADDEFSGPVIDVRGRHNERGLDELIQAIRAVYPALTALATQASGIGMPPTRLVVCDDFAADVDALIRREGAPAFTTDRLGGEVAAKTLWDPDIDGGRLIALNGRLLLDPADPRTPADQVFLVAHELSHVIQEEVRRRSGVMVGVPVPSETIRQSWRSITRIVADEYRADRIAAALLGRVVSVGDPTSATRAATIADTWALNHLAGAEAVIVDLHPALPDLVQAYREWQIPLDALLHRLGQYSEQVMTVLAHWQATCDALEIPEPCTLGEIPSAPATAMYVRPLWEPL